MNDEVFKVIKGCFELRRMTKIGSQHYYYYCYCYSHNDGLNLHSAFHNEASSQSVLQVDTDTCWKKCAAGGTETWDFLFFFPPSMITSSVKVPSPFRQSAGHHVVFKNTVFSVTPA